LITGTAERMKDWMFKNFGTGMEGLRPVLDRTKVDIEPFATHVNQHLKELGLVNEAGEFMEKRARELSSGPQKIVDAAGINRLRTAHKVIQKAIRGAEAVAGDVPLNSSQMKFTTAGPESKKIIIRRGYNKTGAERGNAVMPNQQADLFVNQQKTVSSAQTMAPEKVSASPTEQAALPGMDKKGGTFISFDDAVTLKRNMYDLIEISGGYKQAAAEVSSTAVNSLENIVRSLDGQIEEGLKGQSDAAYTRWRELNRNYHKQRSFLDEVAKASRETRVSETLSKALDPKSGHEYRSQISKLLQDAGEDPKLFFDELLNREAAIQSAPLYRSGTTGVTTGVADLAGRGPRRAIMWSKGFGVLKRKGEAINYLANLSSAERAALFKNPTLFHAINQSVAQSVKAEQDTEDQLLGGGTGGSQ
jgi:hypothetical protein